MHQVALSPRATSLRAALTTLITPRLAQDVKFDFTPTFLALKKGVPLSKQRDAITAAVRATVKDKLAQDADIDDVANLLDAMEAVIDEPTASIPEGMSEEDQGNLELADVDNDGREELVHDEEGDPMIAKIREFIKDHVDEQTLAQFDQLVASENDPEEIPGKFLEDVPTEKDKEGMARDQLLRRMAHDNSKRPASPAMDAAAVERLVNQRVREAQIQERETGRAIQAALREVRSAGVGEIAIACDSAEQVYGAALEALGHPIKGVDPSAYRPMFEAVRRVQQTRAPQNGRRIAQDALPSGTPSFAERFPGAARITVS